MSAPSDQAWYQAAVCSTMSLADSRSVHPRQRRANVEIDRQGMAFGQRRVRPLGPACRDPKCLLYRGGQLPRRWLHGAAWAEIQRQRHVAAGGQRAEIGEVAADAVQHVLPRPRRIGIAQVQRGVVTRRAHHVRHQPPRCEIAAADDVARAGDDESKELTG